MTRHVPGLLNRPDGDGASTLSIYQCFVVRGVVALCANGLPIPPDDLTDVAAVSHETANDDDSNISAWGVYGILFDGSMDNLSDSPTRVIADAICSSLTQTAHCISGTSQCEAASIGDNWHGKACNPANPCGRGR